jgi:cytochrome c553
MSLAGGVILLDQRDLVRLESCYLHFARREVASAGSAGALRPRGPPAAARAGGAQRLGLWNVLVAFLMIAAYGYPIAQFFVDPPPEAVVHRVDAVSNHYAALTRGTLDRRLNWISDPVTDTLVRTGDTARGIPGCQSCHGANTGGPMETPTISGQYREYLALQLTNYANGTRRNDVFNRMRDIASRLTPEEIEALAAYYAAQ